jgi:hypothetical protein
MHIDAAFGFAFLDIEVAFEIVILCIFRDFSKGAQANWDTAVLGPMKEFTGRSKTNMGAGEIDPGDTSHAIEIRRRIKARLAKIGGPFEGAAGEIGFAAEARACEGNG